MPTMPLQLFSADIFRRPDYEAGVSACIDGLDKSQKAPAGDEARAAL
jgi:hypothetical protein